MTRVLIADDDIVVRDVVRRYLERDGLDVSIAHDGTEALRSKLGDHHRVQTVWGRGYLWSGDERSCEEQKA